MDKYQNFNYFKENTKWLNNLKMLKKQSLTKQQYIEKCKQSTFKLYTKIEYNNRVKNSNQFTDYYKCHFPDLLGVLKYSDLQSVVIKYL